MQSQAFNDIIEQKVFPVVNNIRGFFGLGADQAQQDPAANATPGIVHSKTEFFQRSPQQTQGLQLPQQQQQQAQRTQSTQQRHPATGVDQAPIPASESFSSSSVSKSPVIGGKPRLQTARNKLTDGVSKGSSYASSEPNSTNASPFKQTISNQHQQQNLSQSIPAFDLGNIILEEPDYDCSQKLGRLQFSVTYDFDSSTLTVRIIKAEALAAKDLSGTSDPYVKIVLLPDKKHTMTTNIKRKNLNPRWNEMFAFEGFPYHKIASRALYLLVLDYDRFSRDDPIGEVCVPLNELDLGSGQAVWKNLQPCKGSAGKLGMLMLTLCYQPANETVNIIINKAKYLKAKDINGLSDPYVKIWLVQDGKKIEKKKTVVHEKNLNPIFEESFNFTVPYDKIRQSSLVVSVMDYDRMGRNEAIGQLVLGSKSGPMEMKHWNEMFNKCRQNISQWHVLKEFRS